MTRPSDDALFALRIIGILAGLAVLLGSGVALLR
jgi:hypothetical protein